MKAERRRRTLGQHFLTRLEILDEMVEYGDLSRRDIVLEIGAGGGELTKRIAERAGKVIAVEIDQGLAEELREKLRGYSNVRIMVGDVLKLRPTGFNKVISNPPYSISSKLLEWLIGSKPELIVLTLQREFASKLVAKPGSSKYLYISALAGMLYDVDLAKIIPRSFFAPPPRVNSAIVLMKLKERGAEIDAAGKKLLKKIFTRRRQTLRRVLRDLLEEYGGDEAVLNMIPVEALSKRVFQLSPKELLEAVKSLKGGRSLNRRLSLMKSE